MSVEGESKEPRLPDKLYNEYECRDSSPDVEGAGVEEEQGCVGDVEHVREVKYLTVIL